MKPRPSTNSSRGHAHTTKPLPLCLFLLDPCGLCRLYVNNCVLIILKQNQQGAGLAAGPPFFPPQDALTFQRQALCWHSC